MMEANEKKPKVSVCVVTYNQDKYIGQCLQSIVDQQVNFDFDVIVSDDCSTDGTRAIVQEFVKKYPELVKPIFHEKNIGAYKNFVFIHEQATGTYIAHMDGDDYALPGKLQIQSDYLDVNNECNIAWHRMFIKNESTGTIVEDLIDMQMIPKNGFDRADLLRFMAIGLNSSKMYRSASRSFNIPSFPVMDYFVNVEQVGDKRANFVSELPLGVYRSGIGVASSGNATKLLLTKSFVYFSIKYPEYIKEINTAALVSLLADLKNFRWSSWIFLRTWIVTFRLGSLSDLWKFRKCFAMLRFPKAVR
jgi:glycosyltransferase involved in cell wall biosynthesis